MTSLHLCLLQSEACAQEGLGELANIWEEQKERIEAALAIPTPQLLLPRLPLMGGMSGGACQSR